MKHELPQPPDVDSAKLSVELFRGWVVDERSQVVVRAIWKDEPGNWGRFFSDTLWHVAESVAKESGKPTREVAQAIAAELAKELRASGLTGASPDG